MVYRRRVYKKRRTFRRGRRPFKRYYRPRYKKGQLTQFFKRTVMHNYTIQMPAAIGTYLIPISSDGAGHYNTFTLNNIPDYTEFTNLYDTYKICGIRQKFVFDVNNADIGTSVTPPNGMPTLITVNDYNDVSALATEEEAMQYRTYRNRSLFKPISRYFKPTMTDNTGGGISNIFKRRWTPTSEADIVHLGLKALVAGYNFTANLTSLGRLRVYTTYYLAFRTPK